MALDRKYVSRYGSATFAITILKDGIPAEADADAVTVMLRPAAGGDPLWSRAAVNGATPGVYEAALTSVDTQTMGDYTLLFSYEVDGNPALYGYEIEIGQSSPAYDALPSEWTDIIDNVWVKFSDLFDSPFGGPNLQTYAQTNFGRNRLAQLLPDALARLNNSTSGHQTFDLGGTAFPFRDWGGLLQRSLYIEVVKHLIRSYVEQPEAVLGTAISRVDRRDYMNRWQDILSMETTEFERDLGRYKMAYMGLGNVSVLVSGGAYGKLGPYANAGSGGAAAARGYYSINRAH